MAKQSATDFTETPTVNGVPLGGGGASNWGDLGGTLSDQTDLQTVLDAKADESALAAVATTGSYNDLTDTPVGGGGGGQSTYAAVIAPSGGDYTTIEAALAAITTTGARFYVKAGSYSPTSNLTLAMHQRLVLDKLANVSMSTFTINMPQGSRIVGGNWDFTTGNVVSMSAQTVIEDGSWTFATGTTNFPFRLGGTEIIIRNNTINSARGRVVEGASTGNNHFLFTSNFVFITGLTTDTCIKPNGSEIRIINNHFSADGGNQSSTGNGCVMLNGSSSSGSVVSGNVFKRTSGTFLNAIIVSDTTNCTIDGNTIKSSTTGSAIGISVATTNNTISNNTLTGMMTGISLSNTNNTVSGNFIFGAPYGVLTTSTDTTITGNNIAYSGSGYAIRTAANRTVISGNTLRNVSGSGYVIELGAATHATVTGNQLYFSTWGIISTGAAHYANISGNTFNVTGTSAAICMTFSTTCNYWNVVGNTFVGNNTASQRALSIPTGTAAPSHLYFQGNTVTNFVTAIEINSTANTTNVGTMVINNNLLRGNTTNIANTGALTYTSTGNIT